LAVVVASFVSAGFALYGADRVLPQGGQPGHRQAAEEVDTAIAATPSARTAPTAPALVARNHAAAAPRWRKPRRAPPHGPHPVAGVSRRGRARDARLRGDRPG